MKTECKRTRKKSKHTNRERVKVVNTMQSKRAAKIMLMCGLEDERGLVCESILGCVMGMQSVVGAVLEKGE